MEYCCAMLKRRAQVRTCDKATTNFELTVQMLGVGLHQPLLHHSNKTMTAGGRSLFCVRHRQGGSPPTLGRELSCLRMLLTFIRQEEVVVRVGCAAETAGDDKEGCKMEIFLQAYGPKGKYSVPNFLRGRPPKDSKQAKHDNLPVSPSPHPLSTSLSLSLSANMVSYIRSPWTELPVPPAGNSGDRGARSGQSRQVRPVRPVRRNPRQRADAGTHRPDRGLTGGGDGGAGSVENTRKKYIFVHTPAW